MSYEAPHCSICMEPYILDINPPMTISGCHHNFCKPCIDLWYRTNRNPSCPTCRRPITSMEINRGMAEMLSAREIVAETAPDLTNNTFSKFNSHTTDAASTRRKHLEVISDKSKSACWVLDNSQSMLYYFDGKIFEKKKDGIVKKENISRWSEACSKLIEIMKYNVRRGMPATYYHLNPSSKGKRVWIPDVDCLIVNDVMPDEEILQDFISEDNVRGGTPLHEITNHCCDMIVASGIDDLCYGIIGDGEPNDKMAFERALKRMARKVNFFGVMNLCTDDEKTIDYFNGLDTELGSEINGYDVIDDWVGEMKEIKDAGNDFVVYTHELHTCRMAGCYSVVADLLDEEYLGDKPHFAQKLCNELLKIDYHCGKHTEYIDHVEKLLDADKTGKYMVYDYKTNTVKPIIDVKKMRKMRKTNMLEIVNMSIATEHVIMFVVAILTIHVVLCLLIF